MKAKLSLKGIIRLKKTTRTPLPNEDGATDSDNQFEEIKIPDWKEDGMFNEVVDWLGCPFLFNHAFSEEERSKIYDVIYERSPELTILRTMPARRRRLQYVAYDIVLTLGYRESDM